MGTVETGTLSQLLLAIPLQISAGCRCCWSQSRMKILLLAAALVSQVVGRPQQGEYQPGNGWGNTQPAQVLAHSHSLDLAQCLSPCHSLCQHPCHSPCLCHSLLLCPSLCNLGTVALGVVAKCHSQADVNWVLDLRWVLFLAQLRLQDVVP